MHINAPSYTKSATWIDNLNHKLVSITTVNTGYYIKMLNTLQNEQREKICRRKRGILKHKQKVLQKA